MTLSTAPSVRPRATEPVALEPSLRRDIESACARIAPSWPLDRFIAVNPFWERIDRPIAEVAAELGSLSGTRLTMPRAWFRERFAAGDFDRRHLEAAVDAAEVADLTVDDLVAALERPDPQSRTVPLLTDLADTARSSAEPQPWSELCVHQISQHAAAWFDRTQSSWQLSREEGLYGSWRLALEHDRGLPIRAHQRAFRARVEGLPRTAMECLAEVTGRLGLDGAARRTWFAALLDSVRGWAAWCAWQRWEARLAGGEDDHLPQLLAMRAAWEWLLVEDLGLHDQLPGWRRVLAGQAERAAGLGAAQRIDWLLQHAVELAFQAPLQAGLQADGSVGPLPSTEAAATAVFCIDVRSERFRRALERQSDHAVRTRGFAGFFGLGIGITGLGTGTERPQLPGLLAPALRVGETTGNPGTSTALAGRRAQRLERQQRWQRFRTASASAFTFVESCGLLYAWKLVKGCFPGTARPVRAEHAGLGADDLARLRPTFDGGADGPGPADRVELAAGVLRAMGLAAEAPRLPRLVLIAGHGSSNTNNPHAAGLDCGACGGQTGETNARLLAILLDDDAVRTGLADLGIAIPSTTRFVAGLHDTTTDEVGLFDLDRLPESHAGDLARLEDWLAAAGAATRAERAPGLGLAAVQDDPEALFRAVRQRAADWAQVRPEWGLADNAAFVVAPRARTRGLDLAGRVFLHDYDHATDEGYATLTQILTAPMVVTNWINLQYYASTVDNLRYGSGNKVLHNVVGGRVGVFEGNGGDLRIGLAMQSLHDGARWRHTPLRLSVYVEAPRKAIDDVLAAHQPVRHLVEHGWLHLFCLDPDGSLRQRRAGGRWVGVPVLAAAAG